MELEQVRALAGILKENGLSALELSCGEDHIRLEKQPASISQASAAAIPTVQSAPAGGRERAADQNCQEIKSPMVGVFYAAPSPDAEPFVKAGSRVKKGDVLCVIEAMKLMNEVNAEQDGTILEICVKNGDVVEYGQTLFQFA